MWTFRTEELDTRLLELILRFVTLGSVLIGAAAIFIALRNNTRQLGAQIFLSYSERIHNLRLSLPNDYYDHRLSGTAQGLLEPETRRYVIEIIQLVFELHALKRHGYVDKEIWRVWEPDINRLLRGAAARREWPLMAREFATHPKFVQWVELRQGLADGDT
jgi:hypothetical protein